MTDHELSCYIVGRQNHNVLAHQPNRVYKLAESHSQHYPKLLLGQIAQEFAAEIYDKAVKAQAKYGYPELGWATPDWEAALQRGLAEHIQKGDPRDVAVYAMFAWFHGWSTAATPAPADAAGDAAEADMPAKYELSIRVMKALFKDWGLADCNATLEYLLGRTTLTPAPATAAPGAAGETGEAPGIWKHDVAIVPLSAQYWHNAAKKCSTMEGRAACLVQAWDHLVSHLYALNGRAEQEFHPASPAAPAAPEAGPVGGSEAVVQLRCHGCGVPSNVARCGDAECPMKATQAA